MTCKPRSQQGPCQDINEGKPFRAYQAPFCLRCFWFDRYSKSRYPPLKHSPGDNHDNLIPYRRIRKIPPYADNREVVILVTLASDLAHLGA